MRRMQVRMKKRRSHCWDPQVSHWGVISLLSNQQPPVGTLKRIKNRTKCQNQEHKNTANKDNYLWCVHGLTGKKSTNKCYRKRRDTLQNGFCVDLRSLIGTRNDARGENEESGQQERQDNLKTHLAAKSFTSIYNKYSLNAADPAQKLYLCVVPRGILSPTHHIKISDHRMTTTRRDSWRCVLHHLWEKTKLS